MLPRSFRPTIVPGKAKPGTIAVLFDGDCKLCRASAEAVRMYDNSGVVDLLDIHDDEKRALFPGLEMDALMEEIHVVDEHGRVWRGARARSTRFCAASTGCRGYSRICGICRALRGLRIGSTSVSRGGVTGSTCIRVRINLRRPRKTDR